MIIIISIDKFFEYWKKLNFQFRFDLIILQIYSPLLKLFIYRIALSRRNFTLSYDTNLPRQVGLAGSSAIVTATLKCLMKFFNLTAVDLPVEIQPQFILDVEKEELHINAGLQDRVVQVLILILL